MWLPDDAAAALVWQHEQAGKCPGCGLPLEETTDPENEDAYDADELRCWACHARERAAGRVDDRRGLLARVVNTLKGR